MDTYYFGAAEHTTWPLTLDDVDLAIQHRFPGTATRRGHAVIAGLEYLLFDLSIDGHKVECQFNDSFSLNVNQTTAECCAAVWNWFLLLLPAGTSSVAMSDTHPTPVAVPILGSQSSIAAFLTTFSMH